MVDPDLWGHLRYGLDNLEAGQILRTDTYCTWASRDGVTMNGWQKYRSLWLIGREAGGCALAGAGAHSPRRQALPPPAGRSNMWR